MSEEFLSVLKLYWPFPASRSMGRDKCAQNYSFFIAHTQKIGTWSQRHSNAIFRTFEQHNSHYFRVNIADFKKKNVCLDSFFWLWNSVHLNGFFPNNNALLSSRRTGYILTLQVWYMLLKHLNYRSNVRNWSL